MTSHIAIRCRRAVAGAACVLALLGSGCGSSDSGAQSSALDAVDFASTAGTIAAPSETDAKPTAASLAAGDSASAQSLKRHAGGAMPVVTLEPPAVAGAKSVPTKDSAITTTVDSPPKIVSNAATVGNSLLIESLVGQINGRPVFASEILEPLDGRLRQIGAQAKDEATWSREAARAIVRELQSRVEDELILAEAKRNLSPEQKQGLFRFLEQVQNSLISSQSGSAVAADESLKESTGGAPRQEAQDRLDRELIVKELRDKVGGRIVVAWTDIKNEYERTYDKWNPPSVATFRLITVDPKNPTAKATITSELAANQLFKEVAGSPLNTFNRAESGKIERKFTGEFNEGEYSVFPELNQAFRALAVGEYAGPISYNPRPPEKDRPAPPADPSQMRTGWVYLERIDCPGGVSLYDAQLEIEGTLRSQRTNEEVQRYMEQLRKRGNISRMEVMAQRLMVIATDRYAPRFNKK